MVLALLFMGSWKPKHRNTQRRRIMSLIACRCQMAFPATQEMLSGVTAAPKKSHIPEKTSSFSLPRCFLVSLHPTFYPGMLQKIYYPVDCCFRSRTQIRRCIYAKKTFPLWHGKDYIHRTARAGKSGRAVAMLPSTMWKCTRVISRSAGF